MEVIETTLVSPREAAMALRAEGIRCSTRWVQYLAATGRIPSLRIGGVYVLDIRDARAAVLEARERGPGRYPRLLDLDV